MSSLRFNEFKEFLTKIINTVVKDIANNKTNGNLHPQNLLVYIYFILITMNFSRHNTDSWVGYNKKAIIPLVTVL